MKSVNDILEEDREIRRKCVKEKIEVNVRWYSDFYHSESGHTEVDYMDPTLQKELEESGYKVTKVEKRRGIDIDGLIRIPLKGYKTVYEIKWGDK